MANEKDLKVAFLYNFAVYTEWPMPLAEGLTFCILGRDDLGSALDSLANRQIGGKPVTVRHLNSFDAHADSSACHVTYSAALNEAKSGKTPADFYPKGILSVSGIANTDPAIIDLAREGNRLVFDIDNSRAHAAGLSISSKLLRLARSVR